MTTIAIKGHPRLQELLNLYATMAAGGTDEQVANDFFAALADVTDRLDAAPPAVTPNAGAHERRDMQNHFIGAACATIVMVDGMAREGRISPDGVLYPKEQRLGRIADHCAQLLRDYPAMFSCVENLR